MGIFNFIKKRKYLVTLAVIAGLNYYTLHIGKPVEHMAVGVAESGKMTELKGYVVTVKGPLDQKGKVIPFTTGGKFPVYDDPATAEKVANMIRERLPGGIKPTDVAVEDLESYEEDSFQVHQDIIALIKKQVEATFTAKRYIKGPLSDAQMLMLNRKACEMIGIQTQTLAFRDGRILNWMRELVESASSKNNIDLDYSRKTVKDIKF